MSERETETMQEANEPESEARPTSEEDGRSGAAAADEQRPVDEPEMSPAQAGDDERAPLLPGDEIDGLASVAVVCEMDLDVRRIEIFRDDR